MERSGERILELDGVWAGYNGHTVLQDVHLTVRERDFIGVIGANGSGKTTLLRAILGLIQPTRGTIRLLKKNLPVSRYPIGYMPQLSHVDPDFPITVRDAVRSGLISWKSHHLRGSSRESGAVLRVMERIGISGLARRAIGELSGGQRQRVFLARAIVSSPPLLLLDEPDAYVDRDFSRSFYETLAELNQEMAILMVSHDLGTIASQVRSIACVNKTLFFHDSSEITQDLMDSYSCPIDLITHGRVPHRVLKEHREPSIPPDGENVND